MATEHSFYLIIPHFYHVSTRKYNFLRTFWSRRVFTLTATSELMSTTAGCKLLSTSISTTCGLCFVISTWILLPSGILWHLIVVDLIWILLTILYMLLVQLIQIFSNFWGTLFFNHDWLITISIAISITSTITVTLKWSSTISITISTVTRLHPIIMLLNLILNNRLIWIRHESRIGRTRYLKLNLTAV